MKHLPAALFVSGYLLGGWGAIWFLVVVLGRADTLFSGAVGFYYGLWMAFYLPIAIMGTIALARLSGDLPRRLVASAISAAAVVGALAATFFLDADFTVLLIETLVFAVGFWLLVRVGGKSGQGHGGRGQACP